MDENLQYSYLKLDFIMAVFVIRLETQQTLWLCLINCLKFGEMNFKPQISSQVCCCVWLVCPADILLNYTTKSSTQESADVIRN